MIKRVLLFLSALALFSCSGSGTLYEMDIPDVPDDYGNIRIPVDNLLLFADLDGRNSTKTKSSGENCETVSLESLLDRNAATQITFESKTITQIPFRNNNDDNLVMFTKDFHESFNKDSLTVIKIFLIETVDTLGGVQTNVATMIPDVSYIENFGAEAVTFLDKSSYSGIILFSSLDGTLEDIYTYGDGPMETAKVINPKDKALYGRSMHLTLTSSIQTRATYIESENNYQELEASYCIAERNTYDASDVIGFKDRKFPTDNFHMISTGGGGGGYVGGGGVGGGRSDSDSGSKRPPLKEMPKDPLTYQLSLSAGTGGSVSGSGKYPSRSLVICKAEASQNYCFDRWVGDLKGMNEYYTFQIEKNMVSTAYFDYMLMPVKKPCLDEKTGIMNPLAEMKIAPTSKWATNFIGSTFGYTRNSGSTFHSGIDLYAEPGTPLYAMCDGFISRTESYVTEQPVRDKDGNFPPGYSGDKNDAGNRFTLEGIVNGEKIKYSYWHLNEGTPIAINPRTGEPFKRGDKVYQGEIIAYSGKTGNAYNVDFPHLHLVVKGEKGNKLNPEDYINGSVSDTGANGKREIKDTKIIGIKCDSLDDDIFTFYPITDNSENKLTL